jgi:hypothetical protein
VAIIPSWIAMREQWSALGTVDADGIKTWDASLLEDGLNPVDIECYRTGVGIYWQFTAPAACDWYLSQPADWLAVSELSSTSVRVQRTAAGIATCAPGGLTAVNRIRIWRDVWLYVRRQSDGAIAACNCEPMGEQANETTVTL